MKVYVLTSAFHTCEESEQRIVGVYRDKTKALTAFHTEIERIKTKTRYLTKAMMANEV